jgi:iron(II)-dependent oxidoreductase
MRCLRGGAFDTYFDNQATCRFASGESPLARKHNIGFRLAVSMADLVLDAADTACRESHDAEEILAS